MCKYNPFPALTLPPSYEPITNEPTDCVDVCGKSVYLSVQCASVPGVVRVQCVCVCETEHTVVSTLWCVQRDQQITLGIFSSLPLHGGAATLPSPLAGP